MFFSFIKFLKNLKKKYAILVFLICILCLNQFGNTAEKRYIWQNWDAIMAVGYICQYYTANLK